MRQIPIILVTTLSQVYQSVVCSRVTAPLPIPVRRQHQNGSLWQVADARGAGTRARLSCFWSHAARRSASGGSSFGRKITSWIGSFAVRLPGDRPRHVADRAHAADISLSEEKAKQSIKMLAKKGDVASCKILATELVRTRRAKDRIHTSKAMLNSCGMQLQQQQGTRMIPVMFCVPS